MHLRSRSISALIVLGAAALLALSPTSTAWAWQPQLPAGVQGPGSWQDNGKDGRYYVPIIKGEDLTGPLFGIILSDVNCAADDEGLSHCFNEIQLVSGARIVIQDTHNMMRNPCLGPGEPVAVSPLAPGWVQIRTNFRD